MKIEPQEEIAHLRILRIANQSPTKQTRTWWAHCLHCGAEIEISYSGLKTRLANHTRHCRKCNPNGAGVLSTHQPGLEIAGVMILRERQRRSTKPDMGKRAWDVKCIACGLEIARNSNRLRHHDQRGTSCCPKCNPPITAAAPPPKKPKPPAPYKPSARLSGRPASPEIPLATLAHVFQAARI